MFVSVMYGHKLAVGCHVDFWNFLTVSSFVESSAEVNKSFSPAQRRNPFEIGIYVCGFRPVTELITIKRGNEEMSKGDLFSAQALSEL